MRKVEAVLRARIRKLEGDARDIYGDREKFRNYFTKMFRWYLKLLGEKSTPSMSWTIEDMTKFLTTVKKFYW